MRLLLSALMLLLCANALAAIDVMPFKDEEQEQRFRLLTEQLRCPKCQNNSIADSSSAIAADLRQKVFTLMQEGKSDSDIVDYMVARYGNFVTYDPPLTPLTMLLWVVPAAAIAMGGWAIVARSRRRVRPGQETFSDGRAPEDKSAGPWIFIPGAALALAVGAVSYGQTGHFSRCNAGSRRWLRRRLCWRGCRIQRRSRLMKTSCGVWPLGYARRCGKIRTLLLRTGLCSGVSAGSWTTQLWRRRPMLALTRWPRRTIARHLAMQRRCCGYLTRGAVRWCAS